MLGPRHWGRDTSVSLLLETHRCNWGKAFVPAIFFLPAMELLLGGWQSCTPMETSGVSAGSGTWVVGARSRG